MLERAASSTVVSICPTAACDELSRVEPRAFVIVEMTLQMQVIQMKVRWPTAKVSVGPVLNGVVGRKAGTYPLACADHDWDSMVGEIVVK